VFLPEVYATSFGRDVKSLVPGYWLVLTISSYLVSHPTSGGVLSNYINTDGHSELYELVNTPYLDGSPS